MITAKRANQLKLSFRKPVWHNESFADAVVRVDREITRAASEGVDGISLPVNQDHAQAIVAILKQYEFTMATINVMDKNRVDVQW